MSETVWHDIDRYFDATLVRGDDALNAALHDSEKAGLPAIAVSSAHGKFLHLLARTMNAKRVLEIGTLGGYSTIWLARGLPKNGHVVTLEIAKANAEVAQNNFKRAGVADKITIRLGAALETLPKLVAENTSPFDLVFIDADKANIPDYFSYSLKLTRPGSVIIVDNVVRNGEVLNAESTDENVRGVRMLMEMLSRETRVSATALQTVGAKGYDGFVIATVL
ncbi:MAG: O-methyltransferase [Pseudomonadota bacterium]